MPPPLNYFRDFIIRSGLIFNHFFGAAQSERGLLKRNDRTKDLAGLSHLGQAGLFWHIPCRNLNNE